MSFIQAWREKKSAAQNQHPHVGIYSLQPILMLGRWLNMHLSLELGLGHLDTCQQRKHCHLCIHRKASKPSACPQPSAACSNTRRTLHTHGRKNTLRREQRDTTCAPESTALFAQSWHGWTPASEGRGSWRPPE